MAWPANRKNEAAMLASNRMVRDFFKRGKPSRETWDMALSLLRFRLEYDGPGGLDSPRFIQHLGSMAVQIADTLAKHDVDSGEADRLSKSEKRAVERLSGAEKDSFDIGKAFLEARERFRWAKK